MKLLKIVGLSVAALGLAALTVVLAPALHGRAQAPSTSPFVTLGGRALGGPEIGLTVRDIEPADVTAAKLPAPAGALVEQVHQDTPAEKAGFKTGDVVVSFDGEKVRSARHLSRLVEETPEGREVSVVVMRGGERVDLKVSPAASAFGLAFEPLRSRRGTLPNDFAFSVRPPSGNFDGWMLGTPGRLGVSVQDLTGQLGGYFGTRDGALVTSVDDSSPALAAGLKAGDVITKINGQPVHNSAELRTRLAGLSGEATITILRDRKEQSLKATIQNAPRGRQTARSVSRTL